MVFGSLILVSECSNIMCSFGTDACWRFYSTIDDRKDAFRRVEFFSYICKEILRLWLVVFSSSSSGLRLSGCESTIKLSFARLDYAFWERRSALDFLCLIFDSTFAGSSLKLILRATSGLLKTFSLPTMESLSCYSFFRFADRGGVL